MFKVNIINCKLIVIGIIVICFNKMIQHKDMRKTTRYITLLLCSTCVKGVKKVEEGEVEGPVLWALEAGYRLFDGAQAYNNAEQIGSAVHKSTVPRENIYIVDKLASHRQREPVQALRDSLKLMNLSYVDLYLIHSTVAFTPDHKKFDVVDYVDTWKGMEEAKELGLARSIGISNFNMSQIERLLANCRVKPAVLQVEVNINLAQTRLVDFSKSHGLVVMAYTPFGSVFNPKSQATPATEPKLVDLAAKYEKTVAQILLRYLVQRGIIPIPKSVHKSRIEENIDVFDFELSPEDMKSLFSLNEDYRTVYPSFWQDHPFYPYEKVDVPSPDLFHRD